MSGQAIDLGGTSVASQVWGLVVTPKPPEDSLVAMIVRCHFAAAIAHVKENPARAYEQFQGRGVVQILLEGTKGDDKSAMELLDTILSQDESALQSEHFEHALKNPQRLQHLLDKYGQRRCFNTSQALTCVRNSASEKMYLQCDSVLTYLFHNEIWSYAKERSVSLRTEEIFTLELLDQITRTQQPQLFSVVLKHLDIENFKLSQGRTLLHYLADRGCAWCLPLVFTAYPDEFSAIVNNRDEFQRTALTIGAEKNSFAVLEMLIFYGADYQLPDVKNRSLKQIVTENRGYFGSDKALRFAEQVELGKYDVEESLSANPRIQKAREKELLRRIHTFPTDTPLCSSEEAWSFFEKHQINPNIHDESGNSLLLAALSSSRREFAQKLSQRDEIDWSVVNTEGQTAYMVAKLRTGLAITELQETTNSLIAKKQCEDAAVLTREAIDDMVACGFDFVQKELD